MKTERQIPTKNISERSETYNFDNYQNIALKVDELYGERTDNEKRIYAEKIGKLISTEVQSYDDYIQDAKTKISSFYPDIYTGSNINSARQTGLLDSLAAHGAVTLALQTFSDEKLDDNEKYNKLSWIKTITESENIGLSPISEIAEKLIQSLNVNNIPQFTNLKEKITSLESEKPDDILAMIEWINKIYGERSLIEQVIYASRIKGLMDNQLYEQHSDIQKSNTDFNSVYASLYSGSNIENARKTGLLDSLTAHGITNLALQIFYDSDKDVAQKLSEFDWLKNITLEKNSNLSPLTSFIDKLTDSLEMPPLMFVVEKTTEEENKISKFIKNNIEKLSSGISNWIYKIREKINNSIADFKKDPKKYIKTGFKFLTGVLIGFEASDIVKIEPTTGIMIWAGTQGTLLFTDKIVGEWLSQELSEKERKNPKFAKLSRKLAGEKSLSGLAEKIGKFAKEIRLNPFVSGFITGIFGHSVYETVNGQEHTLNSLQNHSGNHLSGSENIPNSFSTESPQQNTTIITTPSNDATQNIIPIEPKHNVIIPQNITPAIQPPEIHEYVVHTGDTLSEILSKFGMDPYGEAMTKTVLHSKDTLFESTRPGSDIAKQLFRYLEENPSVTWRQAINESLIDPISGKPVDRLFGDALRIIRAGDVFNIVH